MRKATKKEILIADEILSVSKEIAKLARHREEAFKLLHETTKGKEIMIKRKSGITQHLKTGKPKGKYVYFPKISFVLNQNIRD